VALEAPTPLWYAASVQGEFLLREAPNRPRGAVSAFERALGAADDPWEAAFIAGWALRNAGHAVLAAGFFAEAVHHDPRAVAGFLGLAECFEELRLHDQAAFYFECAQELDPEHAAARAGAKRCQSLVYGLMRVFTRRDLKQRWKLEIDRLKGKTDWIGYDL
jgi:tetratricopeptide (TPR) repeat protein